MILACYHGHFGKADENETGWWWWDEKDWICQPVVLCFGFLISRKEQRQSFRISSGQRHQCSLPFL